MVRVLTKKEFEEKQKSWQKRMKLAIERIRKGLKEEE